MQCILDGREYFVDKKTASPIDASCLDKVPDLIQLGEFTEGSLLHTIRSRYEQGLIYTSIGPSILVSVNPYQNLDIFTTKVAQEYQNYGKRNDGNLKKPNPHLFMIAQQAY